MGHPGTGFLLKVKGVLSINGAMGQAWLSPSVACPLFLSAIHEVFRTSRSR
jgi:hypothetical protein